MLFRCLCVWNKSFDSNFEEFSIWAKTLLLSWKPFQLKYNKDIYFSLLCSRSKLWFQSKSSAFMPKFSDPGGRFNDKEKKLSSHFAGALSTCAKIITFSSRRRVVLLMATKRPFFLSLARTLPVCQCRWREGKKTNLISPAAAAASGSAKQCSILVRFCAPARRAACAVVVVRGLFREHYFPFGPVRASECRRSVEWSQSIGP